MVSIAQTSKKYRGRKAETYDAVRKRQVRWRLENEAVERMLMALRPRSVLDCPVGTGRFIATYRGIDSIDYVLGIDASKEMLVLAGRRVRRGDQISLVRGTMPECLADYAMLAENTLTGGYDVAVCVRFLDLIEEEAMRQVVGELLRVARRAVILTIRWGEDYVPKVNTATHDRNGFKRLVRRLGWRIEETVPIFDAGWVVMRLGRR